jgi:hypothetical protein
MGAEQASFVCASLRALLPKWETSIFVFGEAGKKIAILYCRVS